MIPLDKEKIVVESWKDIVIRFNGDPYRGRSRSVPSQKLYKSAKRWTLENVSSQVCGPACASSACAYLVVVIGVRSRGPACTSPVCANRPFGRNVGAGLWQFSNLRPGLHSKFATPLHVRTGLRSISCAPACVRRLSPNIRQYWAKAVRTRRAC